MTFQFIKYTRPGWQYNLIPHVKGCFASAFTDESDIPAGIMDARYDSKSARLADAGYWLWNRGVLLTSTREQLLTVQDLPKPSLKDEYIFIRKYWGSVWAVYAFALRMATFKNPFRETRSFWSTRKISKVDLYREPVDHPGYRDFRSELVREQPKVAVIIPTLNRYRYLKDALHDLEKQTYRNFEVIIVDQSDPYDSDFYEQFDIPVIVLPQKEKLLWTARNRAVKKTDAEYLLFFDDDSRVGPDWIEEHLKCLDFFRADISAGVSIAVAGQKVSASYNFFRWADQFDSGNAMIRRSVMNAIGMFDEQFNKQRMGDAEFSYRAYMSGIRSISNPRASRVHLKVGEGGLREMGSWDGFRPKKWFAPKPVPSVIYLYRKYLTPSLRRHALLLGIILSNVPYKQKRSSKMLLMSVLLTIVKWPLLLIQYKRSAQLADKMVSIDYRPPSLIGHE